MFTTKENKFITEEQIKIESLHSLINYNGNKKIKGNVILNAGQEEKMSKWKCHNCGKMFKSKKGNEFNNFEKHIINCFCVEDFFELINSNKK